MPNQINSISKFEAIAEMHDLATLAECDMQWMNTAISHIRKELKRLNKLAEDGKEITQYHFTDLIHHMDMYEYLAEVRLSYHEIEAKRYSDELEKMKGGEA
ncbi:hypothetical protein ACT4YO_14020 [Acinetobacter baumannii]|uniref:hypothetical protein n=1 Tax=Acinetobacter baumannii TaxID=470 RepID=UPI0026571541|nr:hypothetical protein [Acinetobacter baumannii]MDN8375820.1 hypothetical protein [Acinetobacter baumannii]WNX66149.1 hypothetical protein RWA07_14075 [Acinetobacter baumannii]